MDPRHQQRIKIIQELFAWSFFPSRSKTSLNHEEKTKQIIKKMESIDPYIKKYASKFPINKIAKMDLSILRLAIFELVIQAKEPPKVIINEAVELAKEFGGEKSYAFVNGVLGKIIKVC